MAGVSGSVVDSCGGRCPTPELPDEGEAAAPQVAQFGGLVLGDKPKSSAWGLAPRLVHTPGAECQQISCFRWPLGDSRPRAVLKGTGLDEGGSQPRLKLQPPGEPWPPWKPRPHMIKSPSLGVGPGHQHVKNCPVTPIRSQGCDPLAPSTSSES